jgi:hypothetical protein
MTPIEFEEANSRFAPPKGLDESQVRTVPGYCGMIERGSMEGAVVIVTAWQPSAEEREKIAGGGPIYLSFIGSLPPHYPSTSFQEAVSPA